MKLKFTRAHWTVLLIIAVSFAVAFLAYPCMPEQMISHWNAQGNPDGASGRMLGLFLMPGISVVLFLLYFLIPVIDPRAANIEKFRTYFDRFMVALFLFFFYIYAITVLWNIGVVIPIAPFMSAAIGCLFYATGALLAHSEPNWTIGIRTPWTLSSETVWKKTHRVAGMLFKIAGAISIVAFFFPAYAFPMVIGSIAIAAVISFIYSFVAFRAERRSAK